MQAIPDAELDNAPEIDSEAIFNDHDRVIILHQGRRFALQITPEGGLELARRPNDARG